MIPECHSSKYRVVLWLIIPAVCMINAAIPPFRWSHNTLACLSEMVVLILFALRGYLPGRDQWTAICFCMGFLFSIVGDRLMGIRGDDSCLFVAAIGSFLGAHLFFLAGFLVNGRPTRFSLIFTIILLAMYMPYYFIRLVPVISSPVLQWAVLTYLLVSVFSLAGATCICYPWKIRMVAMTGIGMIVFSDTLIAERIFAHNPHLAFLIIPTYVATHFLLTASVVMNGLYGRGTRY